MAIQSKRALTPDDVLRRMLSTPHKEHQPLAKKAKRKKRKKAKK